MGKLQPFSFDIGEIHWPVEEEKCILLRSCDLRAFKRVAEIKAYQDCMYKVYPNHKWICNILCDSFILENMRVHISKKYYV